MSQTLIDLIQSISIICLGISVLLIIRGNSRRKP